MYVCISNLNNLIFLDTEEQNIAQTLDEATFELLFKSNFKSLCWFAVKYVKDLDTAKEIVQDAFINLWEKRENIDLSKPVKSYLSTIIYNKSLNYLRDNKKFNKDLLSFENIYPNAAFHQTDKLIEEEISNKIKSAIDELPEKCKEVFLLSRYENLKYQQIADKLQISIKTVEAQMSKALQHMRSKLVDYIKLMIIFYSIFKNK